MHTYNEMCIVRHMASKTRRRGRLESSAGGKAILRPRDFARQAIHPQQVSRLVDRGELVRVGRGSYVLPDAEHSENLGLALVAAAVPRSTICLLSALRFHNIGTQAPHEVWTAVRRGAARPRLSYPPIRVAIFSGLAFTFGVERHLIDGVTVRIYSAAKTVADCFKYRNKIGLDVAIEALREGLRAKRFTRDAFWTAAKVCRVTAVIRPYLEALSG
jgi:predicted transcriptional regulator of viral defense system